VVDRPLSILQINSSDISGGAQRVAWNLFEAYRQRGHQSYLAVGYKRSRDPNVLPIPHQQAATGWSSFCSGLHSRLQQLDGNGRVSRIARKLAMPPVLRDTLRGIEDFHFPRTWSILNLPPLSPDILHCHNLHIGYFDLRALPWLSQQVPTILTLHDAWLLSGHCAHSFNCERWRIGCGECPDLSIYPDIRRDATAFNWERKRQIFAKSRLYVATPSRWLMEKVEQSIVGLAIAERKVIPNGVNVSLFHPANKRRVREELKIEPGRQVLLFVANGFRGNGSKSLGTLKSALSRIAVRSRDTKLLLIALGETGVTEAVEQTEIRFVPYEAAPERVARYYQAADLYVHAAKVDTFPNTILEALASGTPVVATAVGGIPEQVKGLKNENDPINRYDLNEATGFLVPPDDPAAFALCIERLLEDETLRKHLGHNAADDARKRFELKRQVEEYLQWYGEICVKYNAEPSWRKNIAISESAQWI
jgi:glycosyltransferase involved in cell wall biosynthesis